MKIDSAMIGMESARRFTSRSQRTMGYSVFRAGNPGSLNTSLTDAGGTGEDKDTFSDILSTKTEAERLPDRHSMRNNGHLILERVSTTEEHRAIEQIKAQCVQYLIYWLFGARNAKSEFRRMLGDMSYGTGRNMSGQDDARAPGQMIMQASMSEYYEEYESTAFSTVGRLCTADGRQIDLRLDLEMSRSFMQYYETNQTDEIVKMIDPLVINLDANVASLRNQKFTFDLDADGVKETISSLGRGSGYLALDRNEDGVINDGGELFGTKSGDGFADLAVFDDDGNGWIDENDEIFDKLLIWSENDAGEDELYTLRQAGVGAICLQKARTEFSLNGLRDNRAYGAIRETGIFLYENGNVGTVQHIDVSK
ncbi:MAG: hypothetical protein J6P60_04670 [Lachnospiraceae bacterium]|nr:hypothetical protein [Lachnospiraceae bacterium]